MALDAGVGVFQLNGAGTFNIERLIADFGTNLARRGWIPGGTATSVTQKTPNPPGGYNVTVSGPGTATLTSKTTAFFGPRQMVHINLSGTSVAPGSVITLIATDASSNTYTDSASLSPSGTATIDMNDVSAFTTMMKVELEVQTVSLGAFTFSSLD
jgi:hypothetical protein